MGRHSPKEQLVLKRDRKLEVVYRALPPQASMAKHLAKFIELYPADWQTLVYRYQEYERHPAAGQRPPMLEPTQQLLKIVKKYYRKTNKVVARSTREAQPEAVIAHPQPEAVPEPPQPEAVTEHPQPEAVIAHSQPEAVTEHPQPETVTEHPQLNWGGRRHDQGLSLSETNTIG